MRFEEPLGQAAIVEGLWRAAAAHRLAHALCFSGPSGIGKFLAAEWLAFGLLCERGPGRPCGTCGPCKRVKADSHPDLFVIDVETENRSKKKEKREEEIRVHRIAHRPDEEGTPLESFLTLRAAEGGWRVVLIRKADRINEMAQNALLKMLEEPGANTLLVLETARSEMLLATIKSRCVRIPFRALEREAAAEVLVKCGLTAEEAHALARWSGGAPGRAIALHERGAIAMRALIERVLCAELDAFAAASELAEIEGQYFGKTPLSNARQKARTFLDLALEVLRDLARCEAGIDAQSLGHGDLSLRLSGEGHRGASSRLEQCLAARQDVELNLAPESIVERALFALAPIRSFSARGKP